MPPKGASAHLTLAATSGAIAFGAAVLGRLDLPAMGIATPTPILWRIAALGGASALLSAGVPALRGLWAEWGLRRTWGLPTYRPADGGALPFWLGFAEYGGFASASLEAVEGLLVGGQPGSGKSSALRALLVGFIEWTRPAACRICVVDLKGGVEFAWLARAPHVRQVATTVHEARQLFETVEQAVEDRQGALLRHDTDDSADVPGLGRVVLVIDEMAELRGEKEALAAIRRIAARGRAAGVHLVCCTQRPDRESVPGDIKCNLPGTLAFKVRNRTNSEILVDHGGAEDLPLHGTAVWQWHREFRVRVPFIGRAEAKARVRAAVERAAGERQRRPALSEVR